MLIPPVGLRPISAMDQAPQILLRCKGGFYRKNEEMFEAEKSPNNLQNAKSSKKHRKNSTRFNLDAFWDCNLQYVLSRGEKSNAIFLAREVVA